MIVFLSLSKGSLSSSCSFSTPAFTQLHDVSRYKIWHYSPICHPFVYDSYIMRQVRCTPPLPCTFQGRRPLLPPTESGRSNTWLLELRLKILKMPPALLLPMKLCQFLSLSCSMGSAQSNLKDAVLSINASVVYSIWYDDKSFPNFPKFLDLAKKKHYCRSLDCSLNQMEAGKVPDDMFINYAKNHK